MRDRTKRPAKNRRDSGFTLLEVLAALAVVSIVLTALFSLQRQSVDLAERMGFYTLAPVLAQRVLAEQELKSADGLGDLNGDFGTEYPGFRYAIEVRDFSSELLGTDNDGLKRIAVRVRQEREGLEYTLRTHRFLGG